MSILKYIHTINKKIELSNFICRVSIESLVYPSVYKFLRIGDLGQITMIKSCSLIINGETVCTIYSNIYGALRHIYKISDKSIIPFYFCQESQVLNKKSIVELYNKKKNNNINFSDDICVEFEFTFYKKMIKTNTIFSLELDVFQYLVTEKNTDTTIYDLSIIATHVEYVTREIIPLNVKSKSSCKIKMNIIDNIKYLILNTNEPISIFAIYLEILGNITTLPMDHNKFIDNSYIIPISDNTFSNKFDQDPQTNVDSPLEYNVLRIDYESMTDYIYKSSIIDIEIEIEIEIEIYTAK